MVDADHVRLGRIAGKLAAARAMPVPPKAFGVEAHGFVLGAPLPEAVVAEFEKRHEVTLPPAFRLFVTELGNGGAGPGYGLCRLAPSCCVYRRSVHLARPSPYLPGPRYFGDWVQRYEDPPGTGGSFLRGTLEVAHHGCSLGTRLVVTGPARGRLFNLDTEGPIGPYVVEDADFLAWYERWLDEAVAGYDVGWFGERLPLEEPELVAALTGDPSPERRARAGESLLQLPAIRDSSWTALADTMTTDIDATVRAELLGMLKRKGDKHQRRLDDAEAIADDIARYARSCTPPDLTALSDLRRLTFADVLAELSSHDLEQRRRAAYLAQQPWRFSEENLSQGVLNDVASGLLGDPDAFLRSYGVAMVDCFGLAHLHPRLRELQQTETDPWVQSHLTRCLAERPPSTSDGSSTQAGEDWLDPPF
ncbi:hypothetical protein AB0H83_50425 [Dactylosporangium sp. NPDC050688]|uniref:hypothetical protein n=1 Tax=Dactylosporangium sp. NPDC050688 TaxID=3157217 RepID=UPI00340F33B5